MNVATTRALLIKAIPPRLFDDLDGTLVKGGATFSIRTAKGFGLVDAVRLLNTGQVNGISFKLTAEILNDYVRIDVTPVSAIGANALLYGAMKTFGLDSNIANVVTGGAFVRSDAGGTGGTGGGNTGGGNTGGTGGGNTIDGIKPEGLVDDLEATLKSIIVASIVLLGVYLVASKA